MWFQKKGNTFPVRKDQLCYCTKVQKATQCGWLQLYIHQMNFCGKHEKESKHFMPCLTFCLMGVHSWNSMIIIIIKEGLSPPPLPFGWIQAGLKNPK